MSAFRRLSRSTTLSIHLPSDRTQRLAHFQLGLEFQRHIERARDEAQPLRVLQKRKGTLPLLDGSDPQTWADDNVCKTVAGLRLANRAANLHLQVSELKLRTASDAPQGGSEAVGDGGQKKFLWCPATFKSAKFLWGVKWMALGAESVLAIPVRPEVHHMLTRYSCPALS
jgi:hypothetical protein